MNKKIKELFRKIKEIMKLVSSIGKNMRFEKRKSKMDAVKFLKASITANLEKEKPSFDDYARCFYKITKGKSISRQGFWDRIKPDTINFLKNFFFKLLEITIGSLMTVPKLLKSFSEVYLIDSTMISLPETLKEHYKGYGGAASKSAMRIQCVYNVLRKAYEKIEIGDINLSDYKFINSVIDTFKAVSLIMFDLSYVGIEVLKKIINNGSYFLCRFPFYNWTLYDINDKNKKLDLLSILENNCDRIVEFCALISKKKLPVRLVAFPITKAKKEEVIEKRLKKAESNRNSKSRKSLSENYIKFLGWTIYITNAPSELIKTRDIVLLYRLRWYIELIFKLWKTYFNINEFNSTKKEKVEFIVYIRLIILCFYCLFSNEATELIDNEDFDYSDFSCVKIFKEYFSNFLNSLDSSVVCFSNSFKTYVSEIEYYGMRNKNSSRDNILIKLRTHTRGGYPILLYNNLDISTFYSQFKPMVPICSNCESKGGS